MTDREQTERLVKKGSWLNTFDVARLKQADGTIIDYVRIDSRLNPKHRRVWVFFWKNTRYQGDELQQLVSARNTADWRRRSAR